MSPAILNPYGPLKTTTTRTTLTKFLNLLLVLWLIDRVVEVVAQGTHHGYPALFGHQKDSARTRRALDAVALVNNVPGMMNINRGENQQWVVSKDVYLGSQPTARPGLLLSKKERTVEGEDRTGQDGLEFKHLVKDDLVNYLLDHGDHGSSQSNSDGTRTIYISLNTCLQPSVNQGVNATRMPSQLQLYISQSPDVIQPGPGQPSDRQQQVEVIEGYAYTKIKPLGGDIHIGVSAPSSGDFSGPYNYEIAISIDGPYHRYEGDRGKGLHLVDSDTNSALLVTANLTKDDIDESKMQEWLHSTPPLTMFNQPMRDTVAIQGLQRSFCGLHNRALSMSHSKDNTSQVAPGWQVSMAAGPKGCYRPQQEFLVDDLNNGSSYWGILAMRGNSTASGSGVVGGGGRVWPVMNYTTKSGKSKL